MTNDKRQIFEDTPLIEAAKQAIGALKALGAKDGYAAKALRTALDREDSFLPLNPTPYDGDALEYVVWSNEHKCWWGPNRAGYVGRLEDAGRYTRDAALKICVGARGGRQFNSNPTEVPLLLVDAKHFWPDDQEEWRIARHRAATEYCEDFE